ncbi:probable trehalase isoform X2 [Papaver somniferum]|uniref:probable trehalase isoform X2 n=1 Tax=Papaver somniferum TaxID=3469 RepID=UPI000E6FFC3A|nr:probable trehalase isoform X2 [Papaver somniferum]
MRRSLIFVIQIIPNPNFILRIVIYFFLITTMNIVPCSSCNDLGHVKSSIPLISFLEKVQETALDTFGSVNFDPKLYIDMSLKFNLSKTEKEFDSLKRLKSGKVSVKDLSGFIKMYLNEAGSDLVYHEPTDFEYEPSGFLPKVENLKVRKWALEIHSLWKNLSRKVDDKVIENPDLYTLLPLKYPMVIPGSRFREVYYWDSYWVIRGLLASKMYESAKSIVYNLISLVDEYGFVLNGARAYYSNRSQPPLLSSMVSEIYNRTNDMSFVKKSLPALLKEHKFWNSGVHKVKIQDSKGCIHSLSRYYAMWNKPRPESFTIDKESALKLLNDRDKQHFYRELASTAESGWDFSTRWMRNQSDLTTLATTYILPVDLNTYILKMELDIAFMAKTIGDSLTAEHFLEASEARRTAINSIFWNTEKGQWFDYWLSNNCEEVHQWEAQGENQISFASNFVPIWIELFNSDDSTVKKVVKGFQSSGLLCAAGIATTLSHSSEQWDFPNGWAPLQHVIVEGLARSSLIEARSMAEDIAIRWIRTNYETYKETGTMHEKYDVEACGKFGGGGEYVPQVLAGRTELF